jgi:hypothetical protein
MERWQFLHTFLPLLPLHRKYKCITQNHATTIFTRFSVDILSYYKHPRYSRLYPYFRSYKLVYTKPLTLHLTTAWIGV